jgi:stringent starvation protein B
VALSTNPPTGSPPVSQQPYFLRALYEWCVDNALTPYVTVHVDRRTRVPQGYVQNGQIVLNLGPSAVRNLNIDNEWITFSARFGGVSYSIEVPVGNVLAIYSRETGEGMGFASNGEADIGEKNIEVDIGSSADADEPPKPPRGRPQLRVVK